MKRTAALFLLILAGCAPIGGRRDAKDETAPPAPSASPVAAAAARFVPEFAKAWAIEAEATAGKAGQFRSWEEAFGDWTARNQAARQKAFDPVAIAMDAATGGENAPYDAAALEKAARDCAEGYRRAAK